MVLYLTANDPANHPREFFCQVDTLEVAFEFLSSVVAQGSTLLQAYIVEDDRRTDLPVTVFDGTHFLKAIHNLETEWLSLLTVTTRSSATNYTGLIPLIQQRARLFAIKMATYENLIGELEHLLERTHTNFSPGPAKNRIISQYESMIQRNQAWLLKSQTSHKVILNRLEQLSQ